MSHISICIPYFDRAEVFNRTIKSFLDAGYWDKCPLEIELSIVDDGSTKEPISSVEMLKEVPPRRVVISVLPEKTEWRNPCVPLNKAVRQSSSHVILLQSPEIFHEGAILIKMAEKMKVYNDIILSLVKSDKGIWYEHPKHNPRKFWFCQLMSKKLFREIDGLNELYRDGGAFEDRDFSRRLTEAGANWMWAEDCLAIHLGKSQVVRKNTPNEKLYRRRTKHG